MNNATRLSPSPLAPLRIGLLGAAQISRQKFIPAVQRSTRARIVAVASHNAQRQETFALACGAVAQSYEALLANPDVELVYIALSNHLHEYWTLKALAAGKHVLCEKPLALSCVAVERMVAMAESHDLLLAENLMWLHHPQHAVIAGLIAAGEVGTVVAVRSVFTIPSPVAGNYRLDPDCGGGAFYDLARYPLATADLHLRGECISFRGHSLWQQKLNLAMHGTALTAADEIFSFSMAFGTTYESAYEVIGDRGKIRLDRAYTPPADHVGRVLFCRNGNERVVTVPPVDQFQLLIDQLAETIRNRSDKSEFYARSRRLAHLAAAMERGCCHACSC